MRIPCETSWYPQTLEEAQNFQNSLCARCRHDQAWRNGEGVMKAKGGCAVLAATLACRPENPNHPNAWTRDRSGFSCQHFEDVSGAGRSFRCPRSLDMFDEA